MALTFKRGYKAVEEEKQRQEESKAKSGTQLFNFFLQNDGDEADIRFLTEEPVTYYAHNVKTIVNGKERFGTVTCCGENCPECELGNRPTFKGAYLIIDRREYSYKDKNGKQQTGKDQVRLFTQGTKVLSQLDRISSRYGISNREMTIVRLGKGTSTTYTLERGDEIKLSNKEIEEALPESLREMFDGTQESLYKIIEKQIEMQLPDGHRPEEGEDEEVELKSNKLVSVDNEEATAPKKLGFSSKLKPKENSVKSILKKKVNQN